MIFDRAFRTRALAVLTLGLIFGAGFGIGLVVERNLIAGTPPDGPTRERVADEPGQDDRDREDADDNRDDGLIVHGVGLTAEQRQLVDREAADYLARVRAMVAEKREVDREFNERSRQLIREGRAAIMEHLTEEQRLEYERLLEEFDERRRERRKRDRDDHRDDREDRDNPDPGP